MGYIQIDSLIADMTPSQKIFVEQFYAKYDFGAGQARRKIINIEPLFYQGQIGGSEFNTFVNTKVYLILECKFTSNGNAPATFFGQSILLADETNSTIMIHQNIIPVWDAAAVIMKFQPNDIIINNEFAWNIVPTTYSFMSFIGYRVTLGTV